MKLSRKVLGLCALAIVAGIGYYLYVGSTVPAGQQPLTALDASNFNELRSSV
jgi:hypothetical protein